MKRRITAVTLLMLTAALLAACAPTANPAAGTGVEPAGFLKGLWHGFTMLFTLVISFFRNDVGVYEVNNVGGWYDLGYVIGAMVFWGGGGGGAAGSRKR